MNRKKGRGWLKGDDGRDMRAKQQHRDELETALQTAEHSIMFQREIIVGRVNHSPAAPLSAC